MNASVSSFEDSVARNLNQPVLSCRIHETIDSFVAIRFWTLVVALFAWVIAARGGGKAAGRYEIHGEGFKEVLTTVTRRGIGLERQRGLR